MAISTTLYGVSAPALMSDVYFARDFIRLHAEPHDVDLLDLPGFRHAAAVHPIPGEDGEDMETPWGYGGPVALSGSAFWEGIGLWRQRQRDLGRVAEFVRLHPFLNPLALRGFLDDIRFDRLTVLVDLAEPAEARRRRYSKGTRYSLAQAARRLSLRRLGPKDAPLFRALYEEGLARNHAESGYYFTLAYYERLLAAPWARAWAAEEAGQAVAVACFLHSDAFAHYHLSGGSEAARSNFAHYLLIEHAIGAFQAEGSRWMHLGGGRTRAANDALLRFKTRFSNWCIPFYTGGLIHDRAAFERMARGRTDRFLSYRFPPIPDLSREHMRLAPACANDFAAFFRIKCDVDNIIWSGSDRPPLWKNLLEWFEWHLSGKSRRQIFIANCGDRAVGYAYVDNCDDKLVITIGRASGEGGKGLGRSILSELLARLERQRTTLPIEAWMFCENRASVRAFEAAGFALDESRPPRPFAMKLPDLAPREQRCWVYREPARSAEPRKAVP